MFKTTDVTLFERHKIGVDELGADVFYEKPTRVSGVLITPVAADAVVSDLQIYGRHAAYELCIPKGDTHNWDGCRVQFYDHLWRVYTPPITWIEGNVPLLWNTKVRVERYE